jgi:hypothetical protein
MNLHLNTVRAMTMDKTHTYTGNITNYQLSFFNSEVIMNFIVKDRENCNAYFIQYSNLVLTQCPTIWKFYLFKSDAKFIRDRSHSLNAYAYSTRIGFINDIL